MRNGWAATVLFAVLIFFIPLLAIRQTTIPVQPPPVEHSSAPAQTPAQAKPSNLQETQTPDASAPEPENAAPVIIHADDGFQILDERTGKVFSVSAQDYVRGSLAAEMPPNFHPEALKAQAVAAHTYALRLQEQRKNSPDPALKGADFTADPQNWKSYTTEAVFRERYGDFADAYWKTICEAADAAYPYIMAHDNSPIIAAYHSMSSGKTEDAGNVWIGSEPYLTPVESFGDTLAPDYETTELFAKADVEAILKKTWPEIQLGNDPAGWLTIEERSEGGYVTGMMAGDQTISGKDLRAALDLRSACFDVAYDGAQFTFVVKGYGHGVGLSQYGADYMARQGATFDEILAHYYPTATLTMLSKA